MAVPLNMLTLQRCQERKKAPPAGHRDADSVRWPAGGAYARLFKASALSYALQATARPLGALLMPQASQAPLTAVVVAMMPSGANRKLPCACLGPHVLKKRRLFISGETPLLLLSEPSDAFDHR